MAGLGGLMAWQWGWIGIEVADIEPSSQPGKLARTVEPRPEDGDRADASATEADESVFTDQWEPPVDEGSAASSPPPSGTTLRGLPTQLPPRRPLPPQEWDEPTGPDLPGNVSMAPDMPEFDSGNVEESVEPASETRSAETERSVVQASNEVEQPSERTDSMQDQLKRIDQLLQGGEILNAHGALSKLYWNRPDQRRAIQKRIQRTAKSIYFSPQPHYIEPYVVQPGDQLRKIAGRYKVPWQYLEKLNRIDARRIRPGQKLKVIRGPFSAVVDLSDFRLTVHHHGYVVRSYPVGIGKDGTTPIGTFKVLNKVVNPQYTAPDGTVVDADDPTNPLGERWLDLGDGYGIHGTIEPDSIGRAESRGCIRLYSEDVREVYDLLTVGSEVLIRR